MRINKHWQPITPLSLQFLLTISFLLTITQASYQKVQYLQVQSQITSIQNCKSASNVIFTTSDNLLNYWISYERTQTYQLQSSSHTFTLSCSKYANRMDRAFVAVLDGSGGITVWEEVVRNFYIALEQQGFQVVRKEGISEASVGDWLLAVQYRQLGVVDVYNLVDNTRVNTITFTEPIRALKMSSLGSLLTITLKNETYILNYHYNLLNTPIHQQLPLPFPPTLKYITLDYEQPQDGQTYKLRILISTNHSSGMVQLTQDNKFSDYRVLYNFENLQMQLCDHQLTYVSQSPPGIVKQTDGNVMILNNPILAYTCTTDTGNFVYSEFYAVSQNEGLYFIDCYYSANQLLSYLIGFGIFCCCFCVRLCGNMAARGLRCRELAGCLLFLWEMLCWCPTRNNLEEIQDKLKR